MVHTWYTQNPPKTPKLLILRNNTLPLVRVRVPLSAHKICDLAPKTWYRMVQKRQNGTEIGTEYSSITPQPGPWSSGQFSVIASQVIQVDKSLASRTILFDADSCHPKLLSNLHKSQSISSRK